jgi:hypothetical protein
VSVFGVTDKQKHSLWSDTTDHGLENITRRHYMKRGARLCVFNDRLSAEWVKWRQTKDDTDDEFKRTWKEAFVACFVLLPQQLHGCTEESHDRRIVHVCGKIILKTIEFELHPNERNKEEGFSLGKTWKPLI